MTYERHLQSSWLNNKYRVIFSHITTLKPGETVYQIRKKSGYVLIGLTFHNSLLVDEKTLSCFDDNGKLIYQVEPIK